MARIVEYGDGVVLFAGEPDGVGESAGPLLAAHLQGRRALPLVGAGAADDERVLRDGLASAGAALGPSVLLEAS